MASSIVSFEEKLASVLKMCDLSFNGKRFTLTPRTNEGFKILQLKKGWHYTNDNIEKLVDNAFSKQVSVTHVVKEMVV